MKRQWDDNSNESFQGSARSEGMFEKFLGLLGFVADDEGEEEEMSTFNDPNPYSSSTVSSSNSASGSGLKTKLVSLAGRAPATGKMVILEPVDFAEVQVVVDYLRNKQTVILNLENTEKGTARRIADFVGGAIYALEGSMQKVSNSIILFTPAGVEVSLPLKIRETEEDGRGNSGTDFVASSFLNKDSGYNRRRD